MSDDIRASWGHGRICPLCNHACDSFAGNSGKWPISLLIGGVPTPHHMGCVSAVLEDRDSLRKALDDRFAADQRAARAIFTKTGRTSGFPSVREVVAWYVAEVERLEKENYLLKRLREATDAKPDFEKLWEEASDIADSLRVKLDRAREALERLVDIQKYSTGWDNGVTDATGAINEADYWHGEEMDRARAVLSELSADAPARDCTCHPSEAPVPCQHKYALSECVKAAQQTQISDEVREAMVEAEKALEPFEELCGAKVDVTDADEHTILVRAAYLRQARAAIAKLRSVK